MKRILAAFLALLMFCALLPHTALPVSAGGDNEGYSGECGNALIWSFDPDTGELSILGGEEMWDFSPSTVPWAEFRDQIKSVKMDDKLTHLGDFAFYGCSNLTTVKFPNHYQGEGDYKFESIGSNAFSSCLSLTKIVLPQDLKTIGYSAFINCTSLKSVSFNGALTEIGNNAFEYCTALKSLVFPKSLKRIGNFAFDSCANLSSVKFSEGLTEIGVAAFEFCEALSSVTLPNSLVSLKDGAFFLCTSLTDVTLPKNVKNVGGNVFGECHALKRVVCRSSKAYIYRYWIWRSETDGDWFPPKSYEDEGWFGPDAIYNMLGPNKQVQVFGYAVGAEGKSRSETIQIRTDSGKWENQTGSWADYIGDYAKESGYKFYPLDKFVDVKDGDSYQIPVAWAVGNKVTAGMDATHFAPASTVTRAQAMTFFWAALKKPKFKKANTRFVDVKKSDWYYKPVMWAVENGVTAGTDATHFSPNKTCNRGEILAFLYASLKKPKVKIKNPYKDVSNQWYKKAALWAYANGIEKGEKGKFNASTPCTRASTVTYLYRFFTGMDLAK